MCLYVSVPLVMFTWLHCGRGGVCVCMQCVWGYVCESICTRHLVHSVKDVCLVGVYKACPCFKKLYTIILTKIIYTTIQIKNNSYLLPFKLSWLSPLVIAVCHHGKQTHRKKIETPSPPHITKYNCSHHDLWWEHHGAGLTVAQRSANIHWLEGNGSVCWVDASRHHL